MKSFELSYTPRRAMVKDLFVGQAFILDDKLFLIIQDPSEKALDVACLCFDTDEAHPVESLVLKRAWVEPVHISQVTFYRGEYRGKD